MDQFYGAVILALAAVDMVQASVNHVVEVIAMGNARSIAPVYHCLSASYFCTRRGINRADFDAVIFVLLSAGWMVEMTVFDVVYVAIVLNPLVATIFTMNMCFSCYWRCHNRSPSFLTSCGRKGLSSAAYFRSTACNNPARNL